MGRFLVLATGLAVVVVSIAYFGASKGLFSLPSFLWTIELVLTGTTSAIFFYLSKRPSGAVFTKLYLLSIVIKICFFGLLISIIIAIDKSGSTSNVVFFMVSYTALTALEVALLFRKMNG